MSKYDATEDRDRETRTAEIIWDRDHGSLEEGYYVRLHGGDDIEDVILAAETAADARTEVSSTYPGIEITRCDERPDES